MASEVDDDMNSSIAKEGNCCNGSQDDAKFPSEYGESACKTEDIYIQLRGEIQCGFENLAARLATEFQTLRSELSRDVHIPAHPVPVDGMSHGQHTVHHPHTHGPVEFTNGLDEHPHRRSRRLSHSEALEGFLEMGHKALSTLGRRSESHHHIKPLEKTVMHQLEKSGGSFRDYLQDVVVDLRDRQLKDADYPDNCFSRWVLGKFFAFLSFLIIVLNAAWMGYECNLEGDPATLFELVVNTGFTCWFVLELVLRILALRKYFIFGEDWMWNLLDFLLVLTSVPEFFSSSMNMTFLRLVRLGKLTRAFRLVRLVRFVTSLREILLSLFYTMGSLFWSFVALAMVSYIFALIFMQSLLLRLQDGVEFSAEIHANFKDTWTAMLSLFSMISGGQEWHAFALEFSNKNDYLSMYSLVFYIFFMVFGLVNVIIGVFCAKATDASNADDQLRVHKEEEKRTKKVKDLVTIYNEIASVSIESDDGAEFDGRIDWPRFTEYFEATNSQSKLQSHGLQIFDLNKLWQVMDSYDGRSDGKVDLPSFVMGVMRLAGEAKSTELVMLTVQVEQLHGSMRVLGESLSQLQRCMTWKSISPSGAHGYHPVNSASNQPLVDHSQKSGQNSSFSL